MEIVLLILMLQSTNGAFDEPEIVQLNQQIESIEQLDKHLDMMLEQSQK